MEEDNTASNNVSADNNSTEEQLSKSEIESKTTGNAEQTDNVQSEEDGITSEESAENNQQTIEISEYFEESKYKELENLLDMEPVENPGLEVGFEKDAFRIDYTNDYPTCSMSNKGNQTVQLYGCSLGDEANKFEESLINNGWLGEGYRYKENYIMQGDDGNYWIRLKFGADGKVTEWHWSNWRDGDYTIQIHENTENTAIEVLTYTSSYEPLIYILNMEKILSWDYINGNAYVKDGFYIEFLPYELSMKNEGNQDIEIDGCKLGESIETFENALLNNASRWIKLEENGRYIYLKSVSQPNRVYQLELYCDDEGNVTSWYFNDWRENADDAEAIEDKTFELYGLPV